MIKTETTDGDTSEPGIERREVMLPADRSEGRRIDFILASPKLADACSRAAVINEKATDRLSDHYPVIADFESGSDTDGAVRTVRIVSYNVLEGLTDSPGRAHSVATWLNKQKPSIVALEELNGFTVARLKQEAARWGHEHVALLKEDGYSTGLTSSMPIENVDRHRDCFWHGLLTGETHGVSVFVVHLAPGDRGPIRMREAEAIVKMASDVAASGKHVVILGDFNSQSTADQPFCKHRAIDGAVLDRFVSAEFRDVVLERRADQQYVPSCPTPLYYTV